MEKPLRDPASADEAPRKRPPGRPIMYQTWAKLLFMHWTVPASALQPHIPERLKNDTFDGMAWIGVTPFTMPDIRAAGLPSLPFVNHFHELNVRTYVHYDGVPGVWFFSLDASNPLAIWGARRGFGLPYFRATIELDDPWLLREARLEGLSSTMLSGQGLPTSDDPPLLHAQATPLRVAVWMPEEV